MRLTVCAPLLYWGLRDQRAGLDAITLGRDGLAVACGLLLVAGLWTPFAGVVVAADEAWIAFSTHFAAQGHMLAAALGISLAMLGPGAWSIDARLFGRRVFEEGDEEG